MSRTNITILHSPQWHYKSLSLSILLSPFSSMSNSLTPEVSTSYWALFLLPKIVPLFPLTTWYRWCYHTWLSDEVIKKYRNLNKVCDIIFLPCSRIRSWIWSLWLRSRQVIFPFHLAILHVTVTKKTKQNKKAKSFDLWFFAVKYWDFTHFNISQ